ncbi:Hypothetical protein EPM1_1446 [Stenotrophomonas maltophilia EPM1]|nr:Hypothetical protein EPM1_1446 [Stenotrophomonas maltophilia EPM1]
MANSVLDLCLHRLQFLGRGQPEGLTDCVDVAEFRGVS